MEPAYRRRSLGDLLPAIAAGLGLPDVFRVDERPSDLVLPRAPAYVVLLVDGLGFDLLRDHADRAPFLSGLLGGAPPATVGVPSTTATSLTSLGTALLPGTHGIVGFTSRIPGTDRLLNALTWSKDVDPRDWQPHATGFARLASAGVHVTSVNKREFSRSGLTAASSRGADFVGADRLGERLVAVAAAASLRPSLTYVYEGDLDWTGHRYGVNSEQWRTELSMIDLAAERLRSSLPAACRLVVVADHGMVDATSRLDLAEMPGMRDGVVLLGGEARFRHVYCRSGAVADVRAAWTEVLGERAEVLTREEAVARGWFGPLDTRVRPRVGDVVAACRGDHALLSSDDFPYETRLLGMHGSLTAAEMLVPVLLA